jgi:hypothetical protein
MKGYKKFIIAIVAVLAIYIVAEMNRPRPFNWDLTLSKDDKDPYGGYILYQQLKDIFPRAEIKSYRLPVYNQVNNFTSTNTAYFLIDPSLQLSSTDINELLNYVVTGNYVFLSAESFGQTLMDTLKFKTMRRFDFKPDSASPEFKNPSLQAAKKINFKKMTIDGYINKFDTAHTIVLGSNRQEDVNFIKMPYGEGAFYIHSAPVCFTNYFLVTGDNAEYSAKALSYLPKNLESIYWDEYYKLGPSGSTNPLRFLLNDPFLSWAFRIGVITMVLFVLFEMKRRQRVIPVINPLRNSTLDFVETVATVYFNQRDNKNIAAKKISYFLEYVRSVFYLPTAQLNDELKTSLAKKSGLPESEIGEIFNLIYAVHTNYSIHDETLLLLNKKIDSFYEKVK